MKKHILSLAALCAAAVTAVAATPDYELPLTADSFQGGWDSKYFEADHTIQYTKEYGGNGWYWYDGHDFSAYDQVVVEYSSRGPAVRLTVGYLDTDEVTQSDYMPASYDEVVCPLDPARKDKVRSIMLVGSEAGYVGIKRAYLRVKPEVDPLAPVVLWEGSQALDWWNNGVQILPSRFADIAAGDKLVVDYTADGSGEGVPCVLKLDYRRMTADYQYDTNPLPSETLSGYYEDGGLHLEEYDGERGQFTMSLSPSDVKALQLPDLDCMFITGAHIILNKVTIIPRLAAGITDASVADGADAPAAYYDLTGRRVASPSAGVYIRVQGNRAEKVYCR